MKTLKIIGIVVLVLVVLFLGIAVLLPSEVQVERSLVIPGSSEIVFEQVNDLKQWTNWSPWHQRDPDMVITYHGNPKGEGAAYSWESEKVGSGKLTITESRPNEYIGMEMDFMEEGTATGYFRFKPVDQGTQATWGFEADMGSNLIAKYIGLMMDSMIGSDFEKGLTNLKAYVKGLESQKMADETASKSEN